MDHCSTLATHGMVWGSLAPSPERPRGPSPYHISHLHRSKPAEPHRVIGLPHRQLTSFKPCRACSAFPLPERICRGVAQGEFVPFLQPIVHSSSGHIVGCEVLARWLAPECGIVTPDHFVPVVERNGLGAYITRALMCAVQRFFVAVVRARDLPSGFHFGFNVTAEQLEDLSLIDDIQSFQEGFAGQPVRVELELTERAAVRNAAKARRVVCELRALGVSVALDDFGTGYSNLACVQSFPIDTLKLDQCFVRGVCADARSAHIIDNVIDLAERLKLNLVAEGIESTYQRDFLVHRGVSFLQGYLFGEPMPMEAFWNKLRGEWAQT